MDKTALPEPWLRGTLTDVSSVQRAVLHALELAKEDLERWCDGLSDDELNLRPGGIPSVAFHLRHIARSMDRLLTYAEGRQLSAEQISAMKGELEPGATRNELMAELAVALAKSAKRVPLIFAGAYGRRAQSRVKRSCPRQWEDCWSTLPIIRNGMWAKLLQRPRSPTHNNPRNRG